MRDLFLGLVTYILCIVTLYIIIDYKIGIQMHQIDIYNKQMQKIMYIYEDTVAMRGNTFDIIGISSRELLPCSLMQFMTCPKVSVWPAIVKLFTGSLWSHVALLERNPKTNELSVLEVTIDDNDQAVMRSVKWKQWLELRKQCRIIWRPFIGHTNTNVNYKLLRSNLETQNVKLTRNPLQFLQSCFRKKFKPKDTMLRSNQVTCVEFVVYILQTMQILKQVYAPTSMHPGMLLFEHLDNYVQVPIGVL